jgi:hypothetical protein
METKLQLYEQKSYNEPKGYSLGPDVASAGPVSAFAQASSTFDSSVVLARQVVALADRLCGPAKTGEGTGYSEPARSGVFGALETTAHNVDGELRAAFAAIERIERELP